MKACVVHRQELDTRDYRSPQVASANYMTGSAHDTVSVLCTTQQETSPKMHFELCRPGSRLASSTSMPSHQGARHRRQADNLVQGTLQAFIVSCLGVGTLRNYISMSRW